VSSNCILASVGKPLVRRDARALFCGILTHDKKDIEFQKNMNQKIIKITFIFILLIMWQR